MLNKNTLEILKSITQITNSGIITYPVTTITNAKRDIFANIDFQKNEDSSWEEFGIFDLTSFLNAIDILEDPTIEQDGIYIKAHDKNSSIEFVTSLPDILEDFTIDPRVIETTVAAPSVVEVPIDTNLFTKIKKGSSVFKNLKDLFIIKEGDSIYMKTGNKESYTHSQNSYKISLEPTLITGKDFELVIPIENFLSLPLMDFDMKVKYNKEKDEYRLTFENEIFKFILALKQ